MKKRTPRLNRPGRVLFALRSAYLIRFARVGSAMEMAGM